MAIWTKKWLEEAREIGDVRVTNIALRLRKVGRISTLIGFNHLCRIVPRNASRFLAGAKQAGMYSIDSEGQT